MGNITQDGSAFGEMATDKTIRRTLRLGFGFGLGFGSDGDTSLVVRTGFGTQCRNQSVRITNKPCLSMTVTRNKLRRVNAGGGM